jgi:DNA-3-methyladenine glycosylase
MPKLSESFFTRDVLVVAPELPGKFLAINRNGSTELFLISEVEAYRSAEDKACHASKGRTSRTEIMYHEGGYIYVYLIYGMYWMLNFVTGMKEQPQAALIRALQGFNGPGKLTRHLNIDGSFYGEHLCNSSRIWVEDKGIRPNITASPRVGIDYAGQPWISKPWRFTIIQ